MYQLTKADVGKKFWCVQFASWSWGKTSEGSYMTVVSVHRKYATITTELGRNFKIDRITGDAAPNSGGYGLIVYENEQAHADKQAANRRRLEVDGCIRGDLRSISQCAVDKIHAILIEDGVIEQ